jgi:hypothetical protein
MPSSIQTEQPSLFGSGPDIVANPCCIYERHCGHKAELGPRREWDGGYNRTVTCLHCKRLVGELSTRTDL